MNPETIKQFVDHWIESWNAHNLDAILSHYADNLEFKSPFIALLKFNETGTITSKADLMKYFEAGLKAYPDLKFTIHNFFAGIDSFVIHYTSVNGILAAEVFQLDGSGKAVKIYCNYSM